MARGAAWTLSLVALLGAVFVGGCLDGPAPTTPDPPPDAVAPEPSVATARIGPTGGRVSLGEVTLIVPAGALDAEVEIRITRLTEAVGDTWIPVTSVYRFLPAGLRFRAPATVWFALQRSRPCLSVFWSAEGAPGPERYEALPILIGGASVSAEITRLSDGFAGVRAGAIAPDAGSDASFDATVGNDGAAALRCPRRGPGARLGECVCDEDCPPQTMSDSLNAPREPRRMCIAGACVPLVADAEPCCDSAECEHGLCLAGVCRRACNHVSGSGCYDLMFIAPGDPSPPREYCGTDNLCHPFRRLDEPCDDDAPCRPTFTLRDGSLTGFVCLDGFCRNPGGRPGLPGDRCRTDGYCVSHRCVGGSCSACGITGAACASPSECCSGRCAEGRCGCFEDGVEAPALGPCCFLDEGAFYEGRRICTQLRSDMLYRGGRCSAAFECPSYTLCRSGSCCALPGARSTSCCTGSNDSGFCTCAFSGASCTDNRECCSGHCTGGRCTCATDSAACARNEDCCSFTCLDGRCVCAEPSARCQDGTACCSGRCESGRCVCGPAGTPCRANGNCCTGLCRDGRCACAADGSLCAEGRFCCSGRCEGGSCTCQSAGAACASDAQCCSGRCASGRCACAAAGSSCAAGADCCSGVCRAGSCACAAAGAPCASDAMCCSGRCAGGSCA